MTKDVTKTTAMSKPAARHARPAAEAPRPSEGSGYDPAPEPPRKKNNILLILLAAAVLILVLLFALSLCTKRYSVDVKTKEEETEIVEPTATEEPESTETETTPVDEDGETEVSPSGSRAGGPADDISDATVKTWSNDARSFLTFYPVNHVLAGGADDEPTSVSIEDWATNCLRYVDENSNLGQALANDPESVAETLGFYEVASYVSDTSVVSVDAMGVTVEVTIQGTQMDWQHTTEVVENFLVQFDDNGKIVNVVLLNS